MKKTRKFSIIEQQKEMLVNAMNDFDRRRKAVSREEIQEKTAAKLKT